MGKPASKRKKYFQPSEADDYLMGGLAKPPEKGPETPQEAESVTLTTYPETPPPDSAPVSVDQTPLDEFLDQVADLIPLSKGDKDEIRNQVQQALDGLVIIPEIPTTTTTPAQTMTTPTQTPSELAAAAKAELLANMALAQPPVQEAPKGFFARTWGMWLGGAALAGGGAAVGYYAGRKAERKAQEQHQA